MSTRVGEVWEAATRGEPQVVVLVVKDAPAGEGLRGLDLLSGQVDEWPPSLLEPWENKDSGTVMRRIA